MSNPISISGKNQTGRIQLIQRLPTLTNFRRRLDTLKWFIPIILIIIVIIYEIGPSRWIYDSYGFSIHLLVEIVIFGSIGPLLAFILLVMFGRWIDEKETADLQSQLLSEANEKEQEIRALSDDTLQVLYATSLMIGSFKTDQPNLPPTTVTQIEETEKALNVAIENLRSHVLP